ncbi:MAG: tetratricopeptide repeat protein, partial [Thermoplasmata archaeon]|nr:tetratricopeptide repeat protein [Thermoplasmata archaeon]
MGFVYMEEDNWALSEEMYKASIDRSRSIGALKMLATAYQGMSDLWLRRGEPAKAETYVFQSLDVITLTRRKLGTIRAYRTKGTIAMLREQYETAENLLDESLKMAEEIGVAREKGEALLSLGKLYKEMGEKKKATKAFASAERVFSSLGNVKILAELKKEMVG